MVHEPLFNNYVFVQLEATQLEILKDIKHILNIVYWKNSPAIVEVNEIHIVKDFINDYENIKMEKTS